MVAVLIRNSRAKLLWLDRSEATETAIFIFLASPLEDFWSNDRAVGSGAWVLLTAPGEVPSGVSQKWNMQGTLRSHINCFCLFQAWFSNSQSFIEVIPCQLAWKPFTVCFRVNRWVTEIIAFLEIVVHFKFPSCSWEKANRLEMHKYNCLTTNKPKPRYQVPVFHSPFLKERSQNGDLNTC